MGKTAGEQAMALDANLPIILRAAHGLAPEIRFHSREQFGPCSMEWLLGRSDLTRGQGDISLAQPGYGPILLPASMSVVKAGPLTAADLVGASRSTVFGDGGRNRDFGLWPMAATPGQTPTYSATTNSGYYFSDYQLETVWGEILPTGTPTTATGAACYVHISEIQGSDSSQYLINYYFFCAYNGAMAPWTSWDAQPLAGGGEGGGDEQHYGDVMRIAARVSISPQTGLVTLHGVEFDQHGKTQTVTDPPFAFAGLPADAIQPLIVYSAWHSHEMYPTAGQFWIGPVRDYTDDDGLHWQTAGSLVFADGGQPRWIQYNGNLGNNLHYMVRTSPPDVLTTGPCGPAFKSDWIRGPDYALPADDPILRIIGDRAGQSFQLSGDVGESINTPQYREFTVSTGPGPEAIAMTVAGTDWTAFVVAVGADGFAFLSSPQALRQDSKPTQSLALARGADGSLDYFLINGQQTIYWNHCPPAEWLDGGNVFQGGGYIYNGIAAANAGAGGLHLVYGRSDALIHLSWLNGAWAPGRDLLAGVRPAGSGPTGPLALVQTGPDTLQLFFVFNGDPSSSGLVYGMTYSLPDGAWTPPQPVPLRMPGGTLFGRIAAVPLAGAGGGVTLFVSASDMDDNWRLDSITRLADGAWSPDINLAPSIIPGGAITGLGAHGRADGSIVVSVSG
jgi:hypothetical protein